MIRQRNSRKILSVIMESAIVGGYILHYMRDNIICVQAFITEIPFCLYVIFQCCMNVSSTSIHNRISLQHPFFLADVKRTNLSSMLKDALKQKAMDIQKFQRSKRKRLLPFTS